MQLQRRKNNIRRRKIKRAKFDYLLASSLLIIFVFFVQTFFSFWEKNQGLVAGSATSSVRVSVDVLPSISIDSPSDVTLSPNIQETGTATGAATWNVKTNNVNGWKLEVNSATVPAMKSGTYSFADYQSSVSGTPDEWSVSTNDSAFGFGASGTYTEASFAGNKYLGFDGLNRIQVAHHNSQADGVGDDTTVNFKAEVGAGHNQPDGTYTTVVTATATTL